MPGGAAEPVRDGGVSALAVISMGSEAGALAADFDSMKTAAIEYVRRFEGMEIVTEDDRKAARSLRSDLNSKVDAIERARIDAFKAYDAPKSAFKARCEEVKQVIRDQIAIIDDRLAELDAAFAEKRRAALLAEYEAVAPDLAGVIPLDRFIAREPKLAGRTWSESNAVSKLGDMVRAAVSDRESIRAAAPKFATAADQHYCEHLDLSSALAEAKRLADEVEARERHAEQMQREEAQREARAMVRAADEDALRRGGRRAKADAAVREWEFRFKATKAQAIMIAEYATSLGAVSDGIKGVK